MFVDAMTMSLGLFTLARCDLDEVDIKREDVVQYH